MSNKTPIDPATKLGFKFVAIAFLVVILFAGLCNWLAKRELDTMEFPGAGAPADMDIRVEDLINSGFR